MENNKIYKCKNCEYNTTKKCNFMKHLSTLKHVSNNSIIFKCCNCNKIYKHKSSLWRHQRHCLNNYNNENIYNEIEENEITINKDNSFIDSDLIVQLINENKELKNLLMEQAKQTTEIKNIIEQMKETNVDMSTLTTINYNNKTFNLNVFLNETCKNAMNLSDFINSIQLELSDLINVGEVGYVRGISDIITNNLNAMDVADRPIHCSDGKREILYVKDGDKWEKDENKDKIKNLIRKVALKNQSLILKFKEKFPDCVLLDSQYCEQYNNLIIEAMGGNGDNDDLKEQKIIKNITKNIILDKQKIVNSMNLKNKK